MTADWETLFAPRPLESRAVELALPGLGFRVWFASARAEDLGALPAEAFLAPSELARAGAFKFGQPRENFALGRLAGKLALVVGAEAARALGASGPPTPAHNPPGGEGEEFTRRLRAFEISNGERGEPLVRADDLQSPSSFVTGAADGGCKPPARGVSLSHVNGLGVAVAFPAGQRVGLDLELIDAKRAETVRKGVPLSAEEEAWLKTTSLPEATSLLLLWTAREALGKALGTGLACKWDSLALSEVRCAHAGTFTGRYLHQPTFRCWIWIGPEAVLALAGQAG
jgi:hypothetical protein